MSGIEERWGRGREEGKGDGGEPRGRERERNLQPAIKISIHEGRREERKGV